MMGRFGADSQMQQRHEHAAARRSRSRTRAASMSSPARCRRRRMVTFSRAFWRVLQLLQRLGDLPASVAAVVRLRLAGDARGLALRHALRCACPCAARRRSRVAPADRRRRRSTAPPAAAGQPTGDRCYPRASPSGLPVAVVHLGAGERLRQAARSRRSTRRAPRSAAARCRSSGGGR